VALVLQQVLAGYWPFAKGKAAAAFVKGTLPGAICIRQWRSGKALAGYLLKAKPPQAKRRMAKVLAIGLQAIC
jgi:hypothetical protein